MPKKQNEEKQLLFEAGDALKEILEHRGFALTVQERKQFEKTIEMLQTLYSDMFA